MHHKWICMAVALAVVLVCAWACPAWTAGPNPVALQKIIEAQERHTDRLLSVEGVVGTAAGADGVVVLLEKPDVAAKVSKSLDGVPVVLKVSGKIRALGGIDTTARFDRPVPIGVSTGNALEASAGTIAARVTNGTNVYALSNNHVYALENHAPLGSNVLQPGVYDGGDSGDVIGALHDFEPITFSDTADNTVDAAIALSSTALLGTATPADGYGTPESTIVAATVGEPVQKYGRTTSLTSGAITGVNAIVKVSYDSGVARFVNQIIVESATPFIKAGDSGSLLVTDPGRNPVGLLFAGNGSGKLAIANPIDPVLSRFNVAIDASAPPSTTSTTSTTTTSTTTTTLPSPAVTVTGIEPDTMQVDTAVDVTITGSGFADGADLAFKDGVGPRPSASSIAVVSGNTITARVTAKFGGPPRNRVWDVRVTNPDGSFGVLVDGFTITP